MNENGEAVAVDGETEPAPFSDIVTSLALPPKVFPLTVNGVVPQAVPVLLLRLKVGLLKHPQDTANGSPVVIHPSALLTVIV